MNCLLVTSKRLISSSSIHLARKTVVLENGVIASWHPSESVSFANTRPIPLTSPTHEKKSAVLLDEIVEKGSRLSRGPSNVDLKEIFYTDKNEWFTRNREERLRSVSAPRTKRS